MVSPTHKTLAGLILTAASLPAIQPTRAQNNASSPRLELKDPTPREVDLDKRFATPNPNTPTPTAQRIAAYNNQRQALLLRASAQISSLAATLRHALEAPTPHRSLAPERQVAGTIENLATNIHGVLAPPASHAPSRKPELPTDPDLLTEATSLSQLANSLQAELAQMQPDTLSLTAMRQSAQVAALAHSLAAQLHDR